MELIYACSADKGDAELLGHGKRQVKTSIQIKCPKCNKRLLDIKKESIGEIELKCSQCKQVLVIELHSYIIK